MTLWTMWTDALRETVELLSSGLGLGTGLAIVALTLALRVALLPVSWSCAYRGTVHYKRIRKLEPELKRVRERFEGQPHAIAEATMQVYRRHGVSPLEGRALLGALAQMPVFLGMFHVLRQGLEGARFLWIASLSRPDVWLAIAAAVTTALMTAVNPDLPEQTRVLMIVLPAVLALVFALKFASALALYWAVSNCFTAAQTATVHYVVRRRIRSGLLRV